MTIVLLSSGLAFLSGASLVYLWAVLPSKKREQESELSLAKANEKLTFYQESLGQLSTTFQNLANQALQRSNESFLDLAKSELDRIHKLSETKLDQKQHLIEKLVTPVKESLQHMDLKLQSLERSRVSSEQALITQLKTLNETNSLLKTETQSLVSALRQPIGRGRWGEMQLKRVVEMAGMLERCDFSLQTNVMTEEGRLRPDLVVSLPGGKQIVVDAKTPLDAFLVAAQSTDAREKAEKLKLHAQQVRKQVELLARKSYWAQFESAPEFVVLFLPSESIFSAALEHDPTLIEFGVNQNVILSTPTTLISLLRAVAFGWRQEKLADNARQIGQLGQELYKRISDMTGHFTRVGKQLDSAVDSYNKAIGSLETRVLVSARKFRDLQSDSLPEIEGCEPLERRARELEGPEPVVEN